MRIKVPAVAYLMVNLCFSLTAAAASSGGPIDFGSFMLSVGCASAPTIDPSMPGPDRAKAAICDFSGSAICSEGGATGCDSRFTSNPQKAFNAKVGGATDVGSLHSLYNADIKKAKDAYSAANSCCNPQSTEGCLPIDAVTKSIRAEAAASNTGVNQAFQTSHVVNENSMFMNANVTGACNAYRFMCVRDYDTEIKDIQSSTCYGNAVCKAEADKLIANLKSKLDTCSNFSSSSAQAKALAAAGASDQAKDGADKSGAMNPQSTGGAGGGAGAGAGADSGGSAINPSMLSGLAQMAMGMMQQQQPQNADIPAVGDCTSNPALAGCAQTKAAGNWETASTGQLSTSKSGDSGGFASLGDTSNLQPASMAGASGGDGSNPITTKGVAGGSGGGIPGAGGSSGGATLGGAGGPGAGAGAQGASKVTDVLHGEGSRGGYSQQAASMTLQAGGGGGGGYTYGAGANDGLGEGLHLADFLPGGKKDPGRNIAGVGQPIQIQSKSVNIWTRITEHIRSRCAQGLLRDCGPQ